MKQRAQWAILISILICAGLIVFQQPAKPKHTAGPSAQAAEADAGEGADIGLKAPGFTLAGLDGKTYGLDAYKGKKPVIINFWATWCGPCRDEAPHLVKLHETYGSEVEILAVNLTALDSIEKVAEFAKKYGYTFPVPLDKEGETAVKYEIRPIPSTFFVNKDGIIVDGILGALDEAGFVQRTKELLSGESA